MDKKKMDGTQAELAREEKMDKRTTRLTENN